jgi:glycosyltransferase involved in cell wall biosynthesis
MQLMGRKCEFLSLEIRNDDKFYESCDFRNISSVIIQTTERYEHLFDGAQFETFFIQNAPIYRPSRTETERRGLVYCGTAWAAFGFYHVLEFLRHAPKHTLTVKGAILETDRKRIETQYRDLMDDERLMIESDYLDDADVVEYLRKFRAGFCLYNFDIDWINTFNYFSAPSGKMFKYFAAGVPVIGQDTIGMRPIKEFDCGILIKDLQPETITAAVSEIEQKFEYYSANCLKAASHYSLDKAAQPFIEYLQTKCK